MQQDKPRIIVIGAGFGGLYAARALAGQGVSVLLIDRQNFHTFTPLLYQVATSGLDPSAIAYPVRSIFRQQADIHFLLGEVTAIDTAQRIVTIQTRNEVRQESYDYLIVAAGSTTNYFGMDGVEQFSFGLKSLSEAVVLRNHILKLFERATWTDHAALRDAYTTLVVVGGGPTGLETAGALYELYHDVLRREYAGLHKLNIRVLLLEATDRLLASYPDRLQAAALKQLESLGVEVMLNAQVEDITSDQIRLRDGRIIRSFTLIWAAGVKASPMAELLKVNLSRAGRVPVSPTLEANGLDRVYVVGDMAHLEDEQGSAYPMLIPVAKQQGMLAAGNIVRQLKGWEQQEFKYRDRGIMATIGRSRAVAWIYYRLQLTGYLAWLAWLVLHLVWLMGMRNRASVFVNWVWNYLTYDRSVRIILEHYPRETYLQQDENAAKDADLVI